MAKLVVETQQDRIRDAWEAVRAERDRRLAASDWTQLPDAQLPDAQRAAWKKYRQALRDLPERLSDDEALAGKIRWPAPPKTPKTKKAGPHRRHRRRV